MAEVRKLDQTEEKNEQPKAEETSTPAMEAAPLKGLIGTKIGMVRIFIDDKRQIPVTIISAEDVIVSQVKTADRHGYNAVQIGYGDVLERKLSKAEFQHFAKKN